MSSDDENKDEDIRKMKGEFAEQYKRHSELQAMSDEEFAEAAGDNDFKRQQKAAIEAEVAKGDSRFDNWGSKAKAAKAAGITRPTLDAWIASKKIPERYLRDITPEGAKKKTYEVNISEVIRIAGAAKSGTPTAIKKQTEERTETLEQKLREAEQRAASLEAQLKTSQSAMKLIEMHQSKLEAIQSERIAEAKAIADEAKAAAAELEAIQSERIAEASERVAEAKAIADEAKAAAAELKKELDQTRSRGFIGRLLNR